MCLNCGCHKAHDDHQNPANITYEDVKAAADANGMGIAESLVIMLETAEEDRHQHGGEYVTGEHSILRAGQGEKADGP
ncbi:MAG: hypothetical protein ACRDG7_06230 [Candidatus Limnocylindria bacterium]